jgi:NADH-quinone oxidoreductase subunit F
VKIISNDLTQLSNSDFIIVFAEPLFLNEAVLKALNPKATIYYLCCMDYKDKATQAFNYIKYEVGCEEGICALLLEYFVKNPTANLEAYIKDLDIGYLSAETNIGEEELEQMANEAQNAQNASIFIANSCLQHQKSQTLMNLLSALYAHSFFSLVAQNLSQEQIKQLESFDDTPLETIEELEAFNGLGIYLNQNTPQDKLISSELFLKVAKVSENDFVNISYENTTVKKQIKLDTKLQGTVGLCFENAPHLNSTYKQVKIEKVDAQ